MDRPDDQALIDRIVLGDEAGLRALYALLAPRAYAIALKVLKDPGEAEEVLQDTFLEVWRSAHRFDPAQGKEVTFLLTIARRRLVDRLRRQTIRPAADQLEHPAFVPANASSDDVELRDESARARAAMQQLRPEQREVLELALGHGHSHQEIAVAVGIPLGTVKSHARRGLVRLRAMLGVVAVEGGIGS